MCFSFWKQRFLSHRQVSKDCSRARRSPDMPLADCLGTKNDVENASLDPTEPNKIIEYTNFHMSLEKVDCCTNQRLMVAWHTTFCKERSLAIVVVRPLPLNLRARLQLCIVLYPMLKLQQAIQGKWHHWILCFLSCMAPNLHAVLWFICFLPLG